MTKRIFRAILAVSLAVFLASIALFMGVLYDYFSSVQRDQLRMQTELAAQGVTHEGMAFLDDLDVSHYRITWIDEMGAVLYDSQKQPEDMENHLEREEIQSALRYGFGESSRYSTTLMERSFYRAKKVPDGTVLRLSIGQNSLLTLLLGMSWPILVIFTVALVLSLVLANRLSKKIVEPLNTLDLDHPLECGGYDELTPLLRRLHAQQREIRRQRGELEQAEELRREFSANVSHELKTPLQTISGCSELLAEGLVQEQDVTKFAGQIYGETQRMISLVDDIIKLSHLDEGAGDMVWEEVDLYVLAEKTRQALAEKAARYDVTVSLRGIPVRIYGIPQLLSSILFNLLDNAIQYNRKGGAAEVEVLSDGQNAVLTVRDTGVGIPPEHQERIFERFYRVDKSRSKAAGGTGLGLSIVKHAVALHHGSIQVDSQPGQGTTMVVTLPLEK